VLLPASCRADYEWVCELDRHGKPVCRWMPTGTSSAIDVTDKNFDGCMNGRAAEGYPQLVRVSDHGST
jgi:tRNA-dihydrouridine synthase